MALDDELMKELIRDYIAESTEGLDQLEEDLLLLEQDNTDTEIVKRLFRVIHTIKGSGGSVGLKKIESLAHKGENLLDKVRDGEIAINSELTSLLLAVLDALREMFKCLEETELEGDADYSELEKNLIEAAEGGSPTPVVPVETEAAPAAEEPPPPAAATEAESNPESEEGGEGEGWGLFDDEPAVEDKPAAEDSQTDKPSEENADEDSGEGSGWGLFDDESADEEPVANADEEKPKAEPKADEENEGEGKGWGLFEDEQAAEDSAAVEAPAAIVPTTKQAQPEPSKNHVVTTKPVSPSKPAPAKKSASKPKTSSPSEGSIRVDTRQLDHLMNLVGELVLARNQILQRSAEFGDDGLNRATVRLNHITTELQEGMMKTRMQPIGNAWTKFPRVVRDLSQSLGKQVQVKMDGQETELDRTLIEAIKDPLMHIVRNSVDHGIESPEERLASGKDAMGTLHLSAYHESGQVIIDIMDDGGGIKVEKVLAKAVKVGVLTEEEAENISQREAVNLIFHAGFSTAEKVSNVSGRGVGMDVVRSNIERIGGNVEVQSTEGEGTNLKIKIPLTLAIIPALVIQSADERFAIPQLSLQELVRLEGLDVKNKIETLYGSKVYRLRGNLLPLVFLNDVLKLEGESSVSKSEIEDEEAILNIVILQAEGFTYGLVVDEIQNSEEIVVKPLSRQTKGLTCYAGATIMGDGRVALILDASGLAELANAKDSSRADSLSDPTHSEGEFNGDTTTMLLFRIGRDGRMAIPLAEVSRIEEIETAKVESLRGERVVQHRGRILKLIDLSQLIPGVAKLDLEAAESLQVIVYSEGGQSFGMIVSDILDISEVTIDIQERSSTEGIVGAQPMDGKITEILDMTRIHRMVHPLMLEGETA